MFSFLQILSAVFGSFAHGGNDVRYVCLSLSNINLLICSVCFIELFHGLSCNTCLGKYNQLILLTSIPRFSANGVKNKISSGNRNFVEGQVETISFCYSAARRNLEVFNITK